MNPSCELSTTPSYAKLASFFAPLALQSASQGLTYPLVAMVASRGQGGPLNLAGLAQSNTILFMLGTLGFGLVATGMVFGKTREGFARFRGLTLRLGATVVAIQALLCIPAVAQLLLENWIGLPPSIARPAHITLLASVPLQFFFFLRIPYQVSMYNGLASGRASLATLARIVITALLAPLFCALGAVGPVWAVVCLSLPVGLEVVASALLAAPFMAALPAAQGAPPRKRELFWFNLPLSAGGYLLSLSAILLGAFIARAEAPERMLPAYYLALGLATPVAFGATRIQEVVLSFHPAQSKERRTIVFALMAGLMLGLLPLIFILPGLAEFYYVRLQNLAPADLPIVRLTALGLVAFPLTVALRAQGEGLAGVARKPMTVIAGQAAFLSTVLTTSALSLWMGVAGNWIGALALSLGNIASTTVARLLLNRFKHQDRPVPGTTTTCGLSR
ncbi:MAG: hypothetical protein HY911_11725 [Desulfobacterales bacterium]|nr:hypothetical protein [Desulfobacterales bacterium]